MNRNLQHVILAGLSFWCVIAVAVGLMVIARPAHATPVAAPCPRQPLDAWQACIELGMDAARNQVVSYGASLSQANERIIQQKQEIDALRRSVPDIAWQKASDRLDLWKRESQGYQDRWLYDRIYERWLTHACRNGVPIRVKCP